MRKLTDKEIERIVEKHGRWLRNKEGGERANLNYTDLRNAILEGIDLRDAILEGANLSGANLEDADLGGADLSYAKLCGANLCGASFSHTNLSNANLEGAILNDADLEGAILNDACLSGALSDKAYYQINRIGSRMGMTTYNATDDVALCGCWNGYDGGTLEEFRKRVESVYGENGEAPNGKYYAEYMAAIEFFEKMRALQ